MTKKKPPRDPLLESGPSLTAQLASLEIGDSVARAKHFDGDEATKEAIREATENLRNSVATAVNRAKANTGYAYTVETGEFRSRTLDVNVVIVITRTE